MVTGRRALGWSAGLLAVYGLVRLVPGSRGIGAGWMVGHLALFAALALLGVGLGELARLGGGRGVWGRIWRDLGWAGIAASLVQTGIDLYVGAVARNVADRSELFDKVQSVPGVMPVVYTVVPMLVYVGLLGLLVRAVLAGAAPWWSAALVLVGTVVMGASLDFLAVGAVLYGLAFRPVITGGHKGPRAVPSGA
ncbi:hypothetical protein AB0K51_06270 [Kitasatospora sp. NPDC049285]|uniref:hypothetical protein n=1 Tax=Kitasatospora sp. NPDC049285 TaxID=3157096 RepID=UPI00342AF48A